MARIGGWAATALAVWAMGSVPARAETVLPEKLQPCKGAPVSDTEFSEEYTASIVLTPILLLEAQKTDKSRPQYDPPDTPGCLLDKFSIGQITVFATFYPWQKGEQTLHYRFIAVDDKDTREVLVLYSGMISLLYDGFYFYVSETSGSELAIYAMFKGRPDYTTLKQLVTGILNGAAAPLVAARRTDKSGEITITAYDDKRLK